jgi:hypothetical protein
MRLTKILGSMRLLTCKGMEASNMAERSADVMGISHVDNPKTPGRINPSVAMKAQIEIKPCRGRKRTHLLHRCLHGGLRLTKAMGVGNRNHLDAQDDLDNPQGYIYGSIHFHLRTITHRFICPTACFMPLRGTAGEKTDWKRETAEAQNKLQKRAESHPSSARYVIRMKLH